MSSTWYLGFFFPGLVSTVSILSSVIDTIFWLGEVGRGLCVGAALLGDSGLCTGDLADLN